MQPSALSISRTFIFSFSELFFGCVGLSLLHAGFSGCSEQGLLSNCSARVSRFSGLSCCGAPAVGCTAAVVVARGLSHCMLMGVPQIRDQTSVHTLQGGFLTTKEAPRNFKSSQIAALLYRWMVNSNSPHSEEESQPGAASILSSTLNLPILGASFKWNHTVFVLLCLHHVFT